MKVKINSSGFADYSEFALSKNLHENAKLINEIFGGDAMLRQREVVNAKNPEIKCVVFFIDGMARSDSVNSGIVKPIAELRDFPRLKADSDLLKIIEQKVLYAAEIKETESISEIVSSLTYGDAVVFAEGSAKALIADTKGWETRSPEEPENEKNLRGSREGFTESLLKNTTLLRRRLRTPDLKFKMLKLGRRTNTDVCICYLDSLVNRDVLKNIEKKIKDINIDGVLDTNYIDELTRDNRFSPLKTAGVTERPDLVAANLLEGRVAVIMDGTPSVMTVPFLFTETLQTGDDYYINYFFASIGRLIRVLSLFITVTVPGIYVALVAFHKEMIPTALTLSISAARQGVPLPVAVECIVMLAVFEILRESGLRMPSNVGTALSVVGAIVIGQAAVDAKFVSAPMVIVVSVTGITGLMVSKLKGAVIIYRIFLVLCASVLGMYGLIMGLSAIILHVASLTSYGVKYTSFISARRLSERKDIYLRYPWSFMRTRPTGLSADDVRQTEG